MKATSPFMICAFSLCFISACSCTPKASDSLQSIPTNYCMQLSQQCYCPEKFLGPFNIEVRNGQTVSVTRISDQEQLSNHILGKEVPSLEQILQQIQVAQTRNNHRFEVKWITEPYVPEYVYIDRWAMVKDDEITYRIEGFELR